MADMTNEEFKKLAEDLEKGTSKVDIDAVLYNYAQTDNLNGYDADALYKLEELLNNNFAKTTPAMRDAINAKIAEQRQKLATQAQKDDKSEELNNEATTPEAESPTTESPTAETPEVENPTAESPTAEAPETESPEVETPTTEEKSTTPEAETPTVETPEAATPEVETPTDKKSEQYFDAMTSYDLLIMHKIASENYNALSQEARAEGPDSPNAAQNAEQLAKLDGMIKDIEKYVEKELSQTALGEHNAPIISDYVEIMTAADPDYKYKDAKKLKSALADYDKANALDGELPNVKDIAKYTQEWGEEARKLSAQARDLSPEDKAVFDTLNTMVLTELATEEPDADKEKAAKRYKEKFDEIQAQYTGALNTTLLGIKNDPEQQKAWRQRYLAAHKITAEELKEISRDPARVQALEKDFEAYCTREAKLTLAGVLTTRNAVYASRMSYKTGAATTFAPAAAHKKTMFEKHPEYMQAAKQAGKVIAVKGAATIGFGIIGATAAQGWQLVNTFKKEIKACKEQNGGKLSPKIFAKYLKKNPESIVNIARSSLMFTTAAVATVALVASGAATFGLVGGVAGLAATNAAGGVAIKGIKAAVAGGITAVTGGITAYITNKKRKPLKKELMSILQQNLQTDPLATQKKGLFARFQKTPAEKAYSELTAMLKNGDEKMSETFDKYHLPPEQKERVMQLAKEIRGLNLKATAVVASTALGSIATAYVMEHNQSLGSGGNGGSGGTGGNWDMNKGWQENMEDNKYVSDFDKNNTVEQIPLKPGEHLPEQPVDTTEKPAFRVPYQPGMEPDEMSNVTLPADSFEKGGDMWFATQMGPTVLEEKLRAMGFDAEMDKLPRGSHGAIPSRVMADYLKTANLSEEQAKELQTLTQDRQAFMAEVNRINERDGYNPYAHSGASHTGNGGNSGAGEDALKKQGFTLTEVPGAKIFNQTPDLNNAKMEIKLPQTVEATGRAKTSGLFSFLHHKQDFNVTIPRTGDLNKDVENYAYGVALKQQLAKAGVADVNNPTAEQVTAARAVLDQKGYHITGKITDAAGKEHSFKVVKDADGSLKRIVDGQKMKINEDGVATYNRKVKLPANTVGESNSDKLDRLLARVKTQTASGETVIVSAVRDGETKQDYLVQAHQNGQIDVRQHDNAVSAIKAMGKAGRGNE